VEVSGTGNCVVVDACNVDPVLVVLGRQTWKRREYHSVRPRLLLFAVSRDKLRAFTQTGGPR
jgi:hypothetical protein